MTAILKELPVNLPNVIEVESPRWRPLTFKYDILVSKQDSNKMPTALGHLVFGFQLVAMFDQHPKW